MHPLATRPTLQRALPVLAALGRTDPAAARRLLRALVSGAALQCGARQVKLPSPARRALGALHLARRQPVVRKFLAAIHGALEGARAEALQGLRKRLAVPLHNSAGDGGGAAIEFLFDREQFGEDLFARMREVESGALEEAGQQLYDELPEAPDDPFTMAPRELEEFWQRRQYLLKDVPEEIESQVRGNLQEGYERGESLAQLTARVNEAFGEVEHGRAKVIARTETHAAFGFARHAAMSQQGVEKKQWLVSMSPLIKHHRDLHLEMDGQVADIDRPFQYPGGQGDYLEYPGDPKGAAEDVINCGCTALPYFDEEDAA